MVELGLSENEQMRTNQVKRALSRVSLGNRRPVLIVAGEGEVHMLTWPGFRKYCKNLRRNKVPYRFERGQE